MCRSQSFSRVAAVSAMQMQRCGALGARVLNIAVMSVPLKIGSAVESPQMVRKCALRMDRLPLLHGRLIPLAAAPLCVGLALLVEPMIEESSRAMDLVWEALAAWSISAARRAICAARVLTMTRSSLLTALSRYIKDLMRFQIRDILS